MIRIAIAVWISFAAAANAQTLSLATEKCPVLLAYADNPELLRDEVAVYLDGVFQGIQGAMGINRDELASRITAACGEDQSRTVFYVIRLVAEDTAN